MTDLKVRVGLTPDDLISGYDQDLLLGVGVDPEWYIHWTLRQWDVVAVSQMDLTLFDVTFDMLVCQLDGSELDESQYAQHYARIEEHTDEYVKIAETIQNKLLPYIGDMPNGHPTRNLMGIDFERVGKDSMDIVFSLE